MILSVLSIKDGTKYALINSLNIYMSWKIILLSKFLLICSMQINEDISTKVTKVFFTLLFQVNPSLARYLTPCCYTMLLCPPNVSLLCP